MAVDIRLEAVSHRYGRTEESAEVTAVDAVTLNIPKGRFAVLMGPSGSGKSTLLNLIGAVDRPTSGHIFLGDQEISAMSERELTLVRRRSVGFIFQFFNLIPTLNVSENVAFPLSLLGVASAERKQRVRGVLDAVGLSHRATHMPNQLSGGEMQRVAIARAVVHEPDVLLADEPTGNLDTTTGETILELLTALRSRFAPTIVMATHSDRAASIGDEILHVTDGSVRPGGLPR